MPWYIVHEIDVDQDAHATAVHTSRAAFDSRRRALDYARLSVADAVEVTDPQGNIIYPEEARI